MADPAKHEKRLEITEMSVRLLEHRINEDILDDANVEPIAMVMRTRRLEWFGYTK